MMNVPSGLDDDDVMIMDRLHDMKRMLVSVLLHVHVASELSIHVDIESTVFIYPLHIYREPDHGMIQCALIVIVYCFRAYLLGLQMNSLQYLIAVTSDEKAPSAAEAHWELLVSSDVISWI